MMGITDGWICIDVRAACHLGCSFFPFSFGIDSHATASVFVTAVCLPI